MSETTAERALGFPAFRPRKRRPGRPARTWWANEWNEAMAADALDAAELRHGRAYAYGGHVGPITLSPGRLAATVYDDHSAHAASVTVRTLDDADWDALLDRIAARSGYLAALLERDMPAELAAEAADAGVALLPGLGDLEPECSCDGFEHPCRHAAALSYQVAWLLDDDPFLLLLIRGRDEEALVAELHRRSLHDREGAAAAPPGAAAATGVETPAADAFADDPVAPPEEPPAPRTPGPAPDLTDPPVSAVTSAELHERATQAARLAHRLLIEAPDSGSPGRT